MAMRTSTRLSRNDSAVLGALFDPEASLQNHARIEIHVPGPYNAKTAALIKEKERTALYSINVENPDAINLKQAIFDLTELIALYPKYASAWCNRAQAKRMLRDATEYDGQGEGLGNVFADLAKAIELASPKDSLAMVSAENAAVLASAHTHRGYILWNASHSDADSNMLDGVEGLSNISKDRLEELASRDFSLGGRYGNQTAQQLAVKTNPYAKLCGSIVREALQKEIREYYESS